MELWKAALQAGSCQIEAAGHGQVLPAVQDQAAAGGVGACMTNLDKDLIMMEKLGYGPHYGNYKVDFPNTMEKDPQEI